MICTSTRCILGIGAHLTGRGDLNKTTDVISPPKRINNDRITAEHHADLLYRLAHIATTKGVSWHIDLSQSKKHHLGGLNFTLRDADLTIHAHVDPRSDLLV